MSLWGPAPVENDDAADWLTDLEEAPSLDSVQEAVFEITEVGYVGYLEIPECCIALAAASVLAEIFGMPGKDLFLQDSTTINLKEELGSLNDMEKKKLVSHAMAAVRVVLNDGENSELRQVMEEDKQIFETWSATVKDLDVRLSRLASRFIGL